MAFKVMTPTQVWEDFDGEINDTNAIVNEQYMNEKYTFSSYYFDAFADGEEILQVSTNVYAPLNFNSRVILVLQDYEKKVQFKVIEDLIEKGYCVVIPDYCGINDIHPTIFPQKYAYGKYSQAGEHIYKVIDNAKDTCQYLYSLIIKRAITFIDKEIKTNKILLMGIDRGTEIAMQVAGSDNRLVGLALINGAGYYEYLGYNKYNKNSELEIDEKLLCWLNGVASVAYANKIKIPTIVAISSNGERTDIDRLSNLYSLMENENLRFIVSPKSIDNINILSYKSILNMIERIFGGEEIPKIPQTRLSISDDMFYVEIHGDKNEKIKECNLYYAFDEYDHKLRSWKKIACDKIGEDQFIRKIDINKNNKFMFVFCETVYENFVLSSIEEFIELDNFSIERNNDNKRILYEGKEKKGSFVEKQDNTISTIDGISIEKTPLGLTGIQIHKGCIINYEIGAIGEIYKDNLLQIDLFTNQKKEFIIKLLVKQEIEEEYQIIFEISETDGEFSTFRFSPNQFKNKNFMALDSWENVKAIKLENQDVIIGKIMFV